jgi:uncharacterized peroxidase-related enzyme
MAFFASVDSEDFIYQILSKFNKNAGSLIIQLLQNLMRDSDSKLSIGQRELIAAYVSGLNSCDYCYLPHSDVAKSFGIESGLVEELLQDIENAEIEEQFKPLLKFVKKITLTPEKMIQSDADAVFDAGWDEKSLFDSIMICCMFNFINRFVDGIGLGTEFEEYAEFVKLQSNLLKRWGYEIKTGL